MIGSCPYHYTFTNQKKMKGVNTLAYYAMPSVLKKILKLIFGKGRLEALPLYLY